MARRGCLDLTAEGWQNGYCTGLENRRPQGLGGSNPSPSVGPTAPIIRGRRRFWKVVRSSWPGDARFANSAATGRRVARWRAMYDRRWGAMTRSRSTAISRSLADPDADSVHRYSFPLSHRAFQPLVPLATCCRVRPRDRRTRLSPRCSCADVRAPQHDPRSAR